MDESTEQAIHAPIYWRRVAVRADASRPWIWFGPPVAFSLATAHFSEVAHALMEDTLIEAVFCHSTDDIRVIQANTRSELEGGTPAAE